jgi:hypothetical protein
MLSTAVHIAMSWADQHVVSRCSATLWREHTRRRMCWQGHLVLVFLREETGWLIALFVGSNTVVRIVALCRTTARMCDDYREFARRRRLQGIREEAVARAMASWGGCGVSVSVCERRSYGLLDMSTRWSCLSGWASRSCGPFVLFGVVRTFSGFTKRT